MPPNNQYYGGLNTSLTAGNAKNIHVPVVFKCRICQKMKAKEQFSNKELNGYKWKKANGVSVDTFSAKLRCRNCSGDQCHELQCQGPCSLYKGLDDFSKTQRSRSETAWCMECIAWKESNEPGVIPFATLNTILAPDELRDVADSVEGSVIDNPEGEADSDDEEFGLPRLTMGPTSLDKLPDTFTFPGANYYQSKPSTLTGSLDAHNNELPGSSGYRKAGPKERNPYDASPINDAWAPMDKKDKVDENQNSGWGNSHSPSTLNHQTKNTNQRSGAPLSNANVASGRRGWAKPPGTRNMQSAPMMSAPRPPQAQQTFDYESPDEM